MAHWLSVAGDGSWSHGGRRFVGLGPHEVGLETATAAKSARYAWLTVEWADDPPEVEQPTPLSGLLTPADFDFSPPPDPPAPVASSPPDPFAAVDKSGRVPCPHGCGKDYASAPALERHVEFVHGGAA